MENTVKSSETLSQSLAQPLEQDAAWHSLIQLGEIKFESCTEKEILSLALLIITNLCREVGSSDVLYLAFSSALSEIKKLGMSEEKADRMFKTFVRIAESSRQRNPFVRSGFI